MCVTVYFTQLKTKGAEHKTNRDKKKNVKGFLNKHRNMYIQLTLQCWPQCNVQSSYSTYTASLHSPYSHKALGGTKR